MNGISRMLAFRSSSATRPREAGQVVVGDDRVPGLVERFEERAFGIDAARLRVQAAAREVRDEQLVIELRILEMEDAKDALTSGRRHCRKLCVAACTQAAAEAAASPQHDKSCTPWPDCRRRAGRWAGARGAAGGIASLAFAMTTPPSVRHPSRASFSVTSLLSRGALDVVDVERTLAGFGRIVPVALVALALLWLASTGAFAGATLAVGLASLLFAALAVALYLRRPTAVRVGVLIGILVQRRVAGAAAVRGDRGLSCPRQRHRRLPGHPPDGALDRADRDTVGALGAAPSAVVASVLDRRPCLADRRGRPARRAGKSRCRAGSADGARRHRGAFPSFLRGRPRADGGQRIRHQRQRLLGPRGAIPARRARPGDSPSAQRPARLPQRRRLDGARDRSRRKRRQGRRAERARRRRQGALVAPSRPRRTRWRAAMRAASSERPRSRPTGASSRSPTSAPCTCTTPVRATKSSSCKGRASSARPSRRRGSGSGASSEQPGASHGSVGSLAQRLHHRPAQHLAQAPPARRQRQHARRPARRPAAPRATAVQLKSNT